MVAEVEVLGLGEEVDTIDVIEASGTFTSHFHVLFLVFAYGHFCCSVLQNVGSHEGGVGEQSGVDVVGLLFFECGDTLQFA